MNIKLSKTLTMLLLTIPAVFAQADPCKDETQKAENFYEICVKLDPQSPGYMDCIKLFVEQKNKASETCKAAPPAPAATPEPAPAPAVAVPVLVPSVANSILPPGCMNEFSGITSGNFDLLGFVKKLPVEVVKVKAQAKIPKTPFNKGPDPDDKKTNIGITVGCLKAFPESKNEIMPVLKEVGIEMAMGIVASKAGIARSQIPNDINQLRDLALQSGIQSVADALGFLVGGGTAATDGDDEPEKGEDGGEKGVRFGIRTGFNMYKYSEYGFDPDVGYGFGAGLAVKFPFSSGLSIYSELDFYYRCLYWHARYGMDEYTVSIPIILQLAPTKRFYLAAGAYLDFPLTTNEGDQDITEFRKTCDFGLILGLGYMITPNLGADLRGAVSMTSLFEYEGYKYGSLSQYGIGITYFF